MMQLILASALRASAGKGSPGVPARHVPLNCMTGNGKAYLCSFLNAKTQYQRSSSSLSVIPLLMYESQTISVAWRLTTRPARSSNLAILLGIMW